MHSTRASSMTRLPCWQESSAPCTSSARRGGDHPGAASNVAMPPTSSPTAPSGRNSSPPTSMTTPTRMTLATRLTTRRRTTSETTRRRSSRRSCPEHVLPRVTLISPVKIPLGQNGMRSLSARKATSPAFASWASLQETSLTPTLM
jgi:hypothetical protein